MTKFWIAALKASGPIAIIAFLIWATVSLFFKTEVISLFATEERFIIVLVVLSALLIALVAAIIGHYSTRSSSNTLPSLGKSNIANISRSHVSGDFVMGDKNENSEK